MKKVLIFGNSGSGKSTLARRLVEMHKLSHLDLDTIAWQATKPPERQPISESMVHIDAFCLAHNSWVIEGCYADLLHLVQDRANEAIFMNLPIELCAENAKNRPWERHKYSSKAAQDKNLSMLIDWIVDYETRDDTFSKRAHQSLFDQFEGAKTNVLRNQELA